MELPNFLSVTLCRLLSRSLFSLSFAPLRRGHHRTGTRARPVERERIEKERIGEDFALTPLEKEGENKRHGEENAPSLFDARPFRSRASPPPTPAPLVLSSRGEVLPSIRRKRSRARPPQGTESTRRIEGRKQGQASAEEGGAATCQDPSFFFIHLPLPPKRRTAQEKGQR